jgi:hypothetical protein
MAGIKRTGKSSGGKKGKVGAANLFGRGKGKGPATAIKKHGSK